MLNRIFNTNLKDIDTDKTIEEVKNFYRFRDVPFTWQVDTWDKPKNLAHRLENAGFKRDEAFKLG
jgi:hypothetical protein